MQKLEKILEEIDKCARVFLEDNMFYTGYRAGFTRAAREIKAIIRRYMNDDGWTPVEERSPDEHERIGDKRGIKYLRRLEVAYMTDTIEYMHGYYDGYKWMDKHLNTIENVVAWKIHEPYRPERISNDTRRSN